MTEREHPRKVFLCGTFDVANYGDLLFPLVVQSRLRGEGIEVLAVSPTDIRPPYADAVKPLAADAMFDPAGPRVDGILVGGGYILIGQAVGIPTYAAAGISAQAYPALWIGAALAAAVRDVPYALNAPGAPLPFSTRRREELIAPALASAGYLSVRDEASRRLLQTEGLDIAVVPDSALDLPRVWSRESLDAPHAGLMRRKGLAPGTRCLSVHVRHKMLPDVAEAAMLLDRLARQWGLTPLLVAIGPELGDVATTRELARHLTVPHAVLDDALSLQEVAAAIACSALYLGGSMHGYVTAVAYGVPGQILAMPGYPKFRGLLQHLGRTEDLSASWEDGAQRAAQQLAEAGARSLAPGVGQALDRHWERIALALRDSPAQRERRQAFLRHYLRLGVRQRGIGWVMDPQLARPHGTQAPA